MPRPPSFVTAAIGLSALCTVSWSCAGDSSPSADPDDGTPPGAAAARLDAVPKPEIDWQPEVYGAWYVASPPRVDGALDDTAWESAPWTADFVDIRGGSTPAPRHRTRARLLWDDEFLYVGAELDEPHVWGTLTERDAVIYHDNDFEVFIDPDGDTHLYYEIEINALGTVWDLMLVRPYRDGGPAIDAWDITGLRTGVAVEGTLNDPSNEDRGWTVEIAIPWDVLAEASGSPAPPEPGDRWRLNFSRVQWRADIAGGRYVKRRDAETEEPLDEDNWVWSPQGLIAMHYPEMWGIVEFVAGDAAGAGEADRGLTESERALWALRQVYYEQRELAAAGRPLARAGSELAIDSSLVRGLEWPPAMSLTPSGFEATLRLGDDRIAHIREDGLAWITD